MKIAVHLFIIIIFPTGFCEIYTALASLEDIFQTENVLVEIMHKYVHAEQQKIKLLQRYIEIYKKQNDKACEDVESHIANPINAYLLVKRLTTDWENIKSLIGRNMGQVDSLVVKPGSSIYHQLCRGEIATPTEVSSKLKCRFVHNNNPRLFIAPFKLEEVSLEPRIVIYHDVIADNEIDTFKRLARPRLNRATVVNVQTGGQKFTLERISKSAWLKDHEHKHVNDLSKRVADMTGLTLETAEQLQVVNYGIGAIGGHYSPHFDFTKKDQPQFRKETGNRIATILFYMSDVLQGGATIFPNIKIAVRPKKGTAAFWYNLHASGDGDRTTLHSACPVLFGSKWVCNKWLHEVGQEFSRPCELTRPRSELTA